MRPASNIYIWGILPLTVLLFSIAAIGCVWQRESTVSTPRANEAIRAETQRALELEERADLIFWFERPDDIQIRTRGVSAALKTSENNLATAIATIGAKRDLAVVIIGKPMQNQFPEPKLRAKVDSVEVVLRAQGFVRVVFQLASATGRPIYREGGASGTIPSSGF